MATSLRYVLFNPRTKACTELFSVSPEAPPPTMVQSVPSADEAILLMVHFLSLHPPIPATVSVKLVLPTHLAALCEHVPALLLSSPANTMCLAVQLCSLQLLRQPFTPCCAWRRIRSASSRTARGTPRTARWRSLPPRLRWRSPASTCWRHAPTACMRTTEPRQHGSRACPTREA